MIFPDGGGKLNTGSRQAREGIPQATGGCEDSIMAPPLLLVKLGGMTMSTSRSGSIQ